MEGGQRGVILVINLNDFELLNFHQVERPKLSDLL